MMVEAISSALPERTEKGTVDFAHKSVAEAAQMWKQQAFNDVDTPYFMIDDEVKLQGREWRAASVESVVSMLTEIGLRR